MHSDAVVAVNSTTGFEALYWTPVFRAAKSAYSSQNLSQPIEEFPKLKHNRFEIEKFLYYAITKFHFTPGFNCDTLRHWLVSLERNRKEQIDMFDFCGNEIQNSICQ